MADLTRAKVLLEQAVVVLAKQAVVPAAEGVFDLLGQD